MAEDVVLSGIPFVAVDPDAFSAKLYQVLLQGEATRRKKILFTVGIPLAVYGKWNI